MVSENQWQWGPLDWLRFAKAAGYEEGFHTDTFPELVKLEKKGLVERNPCAENHWRITEKGEHQYAQMKVMRVISGLK